MLHAAVWSRIDRAPARTRSAGAIASVIAAALLAIGCASMPLDQLIFFPDRSLPDPPPGVEERWITTADGVRLHAWYAAAPNPIATLIHSHGNGGNIGDRAEVMLALRASGLSVLAYDYRGYGLSDGRPSEPGVYLDAEAAYDSERARGVPASRIVCFGESLGGAVSIHLATQRACAAVAVVSTFTTLGDVARRHYGPLGVLAGTRFDARRRVALLTVPLFIAHGDEDEIVPFALGERLFTAAPEPKRFLRIAGAHHNDVFAGAGLIEAIAAFVREVTSGPSTH